MAEGVGGTFLRWVASFSRGWSHSRVGGNLAEVLVPAFAGMTFLRWDDGGCWGDVSSMGGVILAWVASFSRRRRHSRVGGNLAEVPAFAGMTVGVGMTEGVGGTEGVGMTWGG